MSLLADSSRDPTVTLEGSKEDKRQRRRSLIFSTIKHPPPSRCATRNQQQEHDICIPVSPLHCSQTTSLRKLSTHIRRARTLLAAPPIGLRTALVLGRCMHVVNCPQFR
ncbi:unnamed protein product [Ectocarpus sp. 4 AP-2014]